MGQTFSKWLSPKRWEQAPFGMVLQKVGHQRKIKQRDYLTSGTLPVIDQGEVFIGGYTNDETARVAQKPPFVIFGDHTRQVKFVHFSFAPGADGVIILKPLPGIEVKLAYYFLQALVHFIPDKGYARHFQFLKKQEFPVPPLVEQRAIVAKIEELFSELDNGIDQLQTIKQQLKQYRQAVLKSAFEGKLTAEWRAEQQAAGNLPDADELLGQIKKEREERYQQQLQEWKQAVAEWETAGGKESGQKKPSRPAQLRTLTEVVESDISTFPDLPQEWTWVRCGYLLYILRSGSTVVPQDDISSLPILRSSAVRTGRVDLGDVRYVPDGSGVADNDILADGDILFTRLNGTIEYVAVCAAVSGLGSKSIAYPDRIFCGKSVVPKLTDYIEITFASPFIRHVLEGKAKSSAGHKRVSMGDILDQLLPLPPYTEAQEIVQAVESRLTIADEVEKTVDLGLQQSEALRQSILKKAFEGRLLSEAELTAVRNDPEYEPADKLLERIKADRLQDK